MAYSCTVVGRRLHAGEDHQHLPRARGVDDLREVLLHLGDRQPAQAVVGAERDDQHPHVPLERPVEPPQPAGGRVARDAARSPTSKSKPSASSFSCSSAETTASPASPGRRSGCRRARRSSAVVVCPLHGGIGRGLGSCCAGGSPVASDCRTVQAASAKRRHTTSEPEWGKYPRGKGMSFHYKTSDFSLWAPDLGIWELWFRIPGADSTLYNRNMARVSNPSRSNPSRRKPHVVQAVAGPPHPQNSAPRGTRRTLELTRSRARQDLSRATVPAHRRMLEAGHRGARRQLEDLAHRAGLTPSVYILLAPDLREEHARDQNDRTHRRARRPAPQPHRGSRPAAAAFRQINEAADILVLCGDLDGLRPRRRGPRARPRDVGAQDPHRRGARQPRLRVGAAGRDSTRS